MARTLEQRVRQLLADRDWQILLLQQEIETLREELAALKGAKS